MGGGPGFHTSLEARFYGSVNAARTHVTSNKLVMSRIVVIGGTGFIGGPTVHRLAQRGHEIMVVHRGRSRADFPDGVEEAVGDRDDQRFLRGVVGTFRANIVLDCISYTAEHAQAVIEAAAGVAQRLVVVSSADVYRNYDGLRHRDAAPPDPLPLAEDAPLRHTRFPYRESALAGPNWIRDYEKLAVEAAVMGAKDLDGTSVRLPKVYGGADPQRHLQTYLQRVIRTDEILLEVGQSTWRWTRGYVEDVAEALATVTSDDRSIARTFNIGDADALTEAAWFRAVAAAAGRTITIREDLGEHIPLPYRQALNWRYSLETSTARIRSELGYREVVGRPEGIRQTVDAALRKTRGSRLRRSPT